MGYIIIFCFWSSFVKRSFLNCSHNFTVFKSETFRPGLVREQSWEIVHQPIFLVALALFYPDFLRMSSDGYVWLRELFQDVVQTNSPQKHVTIHLKNTCLFTSKTRHIRCFVDPSIAVAALRTLPQNLELDLKTFGFIYESIITKATRSFDNFDRRRIFLYTDHAIYGRLSR
jgi:hypothetical protein